jgi:hypothetical protein
VLKACRSGSLPPCALPPLDLEPLLQALDYAEPSGTVRSKTPTAQRTHCAETIPSFVRGQSCILAPGRVEVRWH